MSLLSLIRGGDDPDDERSIKSKARSDVAAARRAARAKAAEVKRRARQDARTGERAVREKKDQLKSKARQDLRTAERRLREAGEGARRPGDVDSPKTTKEIFRLAGEAAELRSPVDATLDPSPSGPELEMFARADANEKEAEQADDPNQDAAMLDPSLIASGAGDTDEDSNTDSENPLEFADSFGLTGGDS